MVFVSDSLSTIGCALFYTTGVYVEEKGKVLQRFSTLYSEGYRKQQSEDHGSAWRKLDELWKKVAENPDQANVKGRRMQCLGLYYQAVPHLIILIRYSSVLGLLGTGLVMISLLTPLTQKILTLVEGSPCNSHPYLDKMSQVTLLGLWACLNLKQTVLFVIAIKVLQKTLSLVDLFVSDLKKQQHLILKNDLLKEISKLLSESISSEFEQLISLARPTSEVALGGPQVIASSTIRDSTNDEDASSDSVYSYTLDEANEESSESSVEESDTSNVEESDTSSYEEWETEEEEEQEEENSWYLMPSDEHSISHLYHQGSLPLCYGEERLSLQVTGEATGRNRN